MKKIINGKLYNTETAIEIETVESELSRRDFKWFVETLYQKKTGEFFLYGEGGPASRYAESFMGGWIEGSKIIPLSYEAASKWAEENMSVNGYCSIFGEVSEEGTGRKTVTLSISVEAAETAKREAIKRGISFSSYIEGLILEKRAGD